MKQKLLILALLANTALFAQSIPNNGFETWINKGSYFDPQGWGTTNDSVKTGSYYPVTMSTDHYPLNVGSYSIRIESQQSNTWPPPAWQDWGLAWTGGWKGLNYPVFAISGHPTSLCGYYKWIPQNGDTMNIHIRLYKNGVDVGGGILQDSTSKSGWTSFHIPFSSYTDADSARIMLACYADKTMLAHGNSVLYVDNLSFDTLLTDVPVLIANNMGTMKIYPNPVSQTLCIDFNNTMHPEGATLIIMDMYGKVVMETHPDFSNGTVLLNVSSLASGVYLIKIMSSNFEYVTKFIKQ